MEKKWYLRTAEGKVFGPIEFETLKGWARDGRVEPFAGISTDLKNWVLASLKPELELEWVIENEPGRFYGPTHRSVIDDLVRQGALGEGRRLYRDDHDGALLGELKERAQSLSLSLEQQRAQSQADQKTIAALEARVKGLEEENAGLKAAAIAAKKSYEGVRSDLESARSDLEESKAQLAASRKETEFHKKQLDTSRAECERQRTVIASLKAVADNASSAKDSREQEIASLRRTAARELAARDSEIESLRAEVAKLTTSPKRHWETMIFEPEVVSADPPPPSAKTLFHQHANSGLAALERQAQSELARMGADDLRKIFGR